MRYKKNYGGGGGAPATTTKTVESIPEWMKPAIQRVQGSAEALYGSGQLGNVAGASDLQRRAFGSASAVEAAGASAQGTLAEQQARLKQQAMSGGANELQDALRLDVGMASADLGNKFGSAGVLGSARHALADKTSEDAAKAKFAQQVIQNKSAAEQALGKSATDAAATASGTSATLAKLGGEQRTIEQQQADAPYQALQRYASTIYGNPGRQQAVQESSGGGGK